MVRMKYCGNIDLEYLEGTIVSNMVNKHIKEIEEKGLILKDVKMEELNGSLYIWIFYEENFFK